MEKSNILILIEQQNDHFPAMSEFLRKRNLDSTTLFLPQTLKNIAEEISSNSYLLIECINYLDIVKIYSLIIYDDPEYFTSNIKSLIISNRTVANSKLVINNEVIDDFLFTSEEALDEFIESNKFLLALYIFSLVRQLFFKFSQGEKNA